LEGKNIMQELSTTNPTNLSPVTLNAQPLTLKNFLDVSKNFAPVELGKDSVKNILTARECIEKRLISGGTFYGINTGFGALAETRIETKDLSNLQLNLIRSHACGVGEPLPEDTVRGMLLLRLQTICLGHTGATLETATIICKFLNHRIHPVVPSQGSVGACGDLAPLAHLALSLIGEGTVCYQNKIVPSLVAINAEGFEPLLPQAKEGLCLINGTQAMTSIGLSAVHNAILLTEQSNIICALSTEAIRGSQSAFSANIHKARGHKYQEYCAEKINSLLQNSEILKSHTLCNRVQDPYSFRCAPQVHSASLSALHYALDILMIEANSSTDNPLVFPNSDEILSGGNFHGQPVALALDFAAIALCEIASISERRTDKMVTPHLSQLPAFLTKNPGLNSGFMIPHVVAASLVSQNKTLAHPCSVDSIPTSAEKEDHVSMGMNSALKLREVLKNTAYVLSIELLGACQGIDLLRPLKTSPNLEQVHKMVRSKSKKLEEDRSLSNDIEAIQKELLNGFLVSIL
jgi:histidine ammonia-lyase